VPAIPIPAQGTKRPTIKNSENCYAISAKAGAEGKGSVHAIQPILQIANETSARTDRCMGTAGTATCTKTDATPRHHRCAFSGPYLMTSINGTKYTVWEYHTKNNLTRHPKDT